MADRNDSWKKYLPKDGPKTDRRSDYLKARAHSGGQVLNFCPFGCEDHTLDDQGRCLHLVGNTHQPEHEGERPKIYSPLKYGRNLDGSIQFDVLVTDGADPQPVHEKDVLIPVSVDSMVYRRNAGERPAVKKHRIPDKMMTVLGVKNEDGDTVPMTLADLQPKKKTRKKKTKAADLQPSST